MVSPAKLACVECQSFTLWRMVLFLITNEKDVKEFPVLWCGLYPSQKHLVPLLMTVCGCQGRLHMHSADPVELHWP